MVLPPDLDQPLPLRLRREEAHELRPAGLRLQHLEAPVAQPRDVVHEGLRRLLELAEQRAVLVRPDPRLAHALEEVVEALLRRHGEHPLRRGPLVARSGLRRRVVLQGGPDQRLAHLQHPPPQGRVLRRDPALEPRRRIAVLQEEAEGVEVARFKVVAQVELGRRLQPRLLHHQDHGRARARREEVRALGAQHEALLARDAQPHPQPLHGRAQQPLLRRLLGPPGQQRRDHEPRHAAEEPHHQADDEGPGPVPRVRPRLRHRHGHHRALREPQVGQHPR
mmetsp:Transcript_83900/g.224465  ORF Transcript_83900/g.224465 Transcript_83900/m.224465 type:complete len:279 (+) Transcript_83900:1057-1893(+)